MHQPDPDGGKAQHVPVVLYAEDEFLIRMDGAEALREAGLCVVEASDGAAALAILSDDQPVDLLVTDVQMPGAADGLDLAVAARRLRPGLPVAILSANPPAGAAALVDRVLRKPLCRSELVGAVLALLGRPCLARQ